MHDFSEGFDSHQDRLRFLESCWAPLEKSYSLQKRNYPAPRSYTSGRNNALRTIAWFLEGKYPLGMDVIELSLLFDMRKRIKGLTHVLSSLKT